MTSDAFKTVERASVLAYRNTIKHRHVINCILEHKTLTDEMLEDFEREACIEVNRILEHNYFEIKEKND